MARSLLAVVVVSAGMAVCGATLKVPLKTGWKFVKADDPKYVCDASMSNEVRKLSAILDRAERGDLSGGIDFDWAKPSFDDSSWKEVRVPHDWGVEKPFDPDRAYGDAFLDVTGIGWYRLKLRVESGELKVGGRAIPVPNDGKVYFECDGAMSYAMLYVDGKFAGGWPYGIIWRTGKTAAGERVAFVANLSRGDRSLRIGGSWRELLAGRDVSGAFTLAPCEVLLIKEN